MKSFETPSRYLRETMRHEKRTKLMRAYRVRDAHRCGNLLGDLRMLQHLARQLLLAGRALTRREHAEVANELSARDRI